VPQVKQFKLRIAKRPTLPSEIASALWQTGVHIQAFSADLQDQSRSRQADVHWERLESHRGSSAGPNPRPEARSSDL